MGPEESGAGAPMGMRLLVFLWLFGCWIVDASIFVAVCSDRSFVIGSWLVVALLWGARGWGF